MLVAYYLQFLQLQEKDKDMKKIKVGLNGVGRIGRTIIRQLFSSPSEQIELVAVNNPGDAVYSHPKYDSVHGTFPGDVFHHEGM